MIKQVTVIILSMALGIYSATADNNILSVSKTGSGQPMILIHGMACSAEVWTEVAEKYQNQYEIHLVTISGFGNQKFLEAPHVLKAVRDELIHYVKSEGLHKPVLMGHSMGGFLSLWAASAEPDLFGKIISVDGLPYFPAMAWPGMTPEAARPFVDQMQAAMRNQNPEAARSYQESMIASMIATESKREKVVNMGMNSNGNVIGQAMGEMYTTDIREEVANIKIPLLALGSWYAYRNFGTTKESATAGYLAQFSKIESARFEMADTALHFIFYDDPEWFFGMVDDFLGK